MSDSLQRRIAELAERLPSLSGPDDKRIRKRILQNIGKLNKQIQSVKEGRCNVDDSNAKDIVALPLSRKDKKRKLIILNNEIADLAKKKQLKLACKRFNWGKRKGLEYSVHTYTNLMNAFVRCEDISGALRVWDELKASNLSPNIVSYTTLIKCYAESGLIGEAYRVLSEEIPSNNLQANSRTVSTFLRGCMKHGAVEPANRVLQIIDDLPDNRDVCVSYVVQLLSQALQLERSTSIYEPYISPTSDSSAGNTSVDATPSLRIAQAYALVGNWIETEFWINITKERLLRQKQEPLRAAMLKKIRGVEGDDEEEGGDDEDHKNGGRANRQHHSDASAALFAEHRLQELQFETSALVTYVKLKKGDRLVEVISTCLSVMSRVFLSCPMPWTRDTTPESERLKSKALRTVAHDRALAYCVHLNDAYGLMSLCHELASAMSVTGDGGRERSRSLHTECDRVVGEFVQDIRRSVSSSGTLILDHVFAPRRYHHPRLLNAMNAEVTPAVSVAARPAARSTKLELGSGHGDWVVERARAELERSWWFAVERRVDRVHSIFNKAVHAGVTNLAVIAGDALHTLKSILPPCSITEAFVNFPEPPERLSGEGESQGQHMLTSAFFVALRTVLVPGGLCTIVSDNHKYLLSVAHTIAALAPEHRYRSVDQSTNLEDGDVEVEEDVNGSGKGVGTGQQGECRPPLVEIQVHRGDAEERGEVGEGAAATSSYFSRLWTRGEKKRRWFLQVQVHAAV